MQLAKACLANLFLLSYASEGTLRQVVEGMLMIKFIYYVPIIQKFHSAERVKMGIRKELWNGANF